MFRTISFIKTLNRSIPSSTPSFHSPNALRSIACLSSLSNNAPSIIYTHTDEAPALATYSFLPIIRSFLNKADVKVELYDISLANRLLSQFDTSATDYLEILRSEVQKPDCFLIKLPNISASIPQLKDAISELQKQNYKVPNYNPKKMSPEIKEKFDKVLGSVVNPVLREGNSDRRVATPVKEHAQQHPHRMMKPFSSDCTAQVVHMNSDDFYDSEKSLTVGKNNVNYEIVFVGLNGQRTTLKKKYEVPSGSVVDCSVMDMEKLKEFYKKNIEETAEKAKDRPTLLSLHLKCTMMKVSDPIMFGACVKEYYDSVFKKHEATFAELGINENNGLSDVYEKIHASQLSPEEIMEIEQDIQSVYRDDSRPELAMVNSAKGITNLHVPSDVIIDASMPNVVRDGGKMWSPDDKLEDVICMIPDRCYATIYKEILNFAKENGQFDPATMGTVNNVGLMAKKAEEYGSHDKTFQADAAGKIVIIDADTQEEILSQDVQPGDIFRSCTTMEVAIKDWVKLAVTRSKLSGFPVAFWLDPNRGHDSELIKHVVYELQHYLPADQVKTIASASNVDYQIIPEPSNVDQVDVSISSPVDAMRESCEAIVKGENRIAATGNVLRDYLTDLFPILELGTSAKMLSIVSLLAGGGMYETGAGGSAPKHVQQFEEEGHLRWDSLGEFLALSVTLVDLGTKTNNTEVVKYGEALEQAVTKLLSNQKSPGRKVGDTGNAESHFWLATYWAEALKDINADFTELFDQLSTKEQDIVEEFRAAEGRSKDLEGYYFPDPEKAGRAMRPSKSLNAIIDGF
eukprot:maker-scaffold_15-snap-gene-9.64-mRNA-1 protein AED:0.01 eAED:0.01 QI:78/1/1/1/1/1/2/78/798